MTQTTLLLLLAHLVCVCATCCQLLSHQPLVSGSGVFANSQCIATRARPSLPQEEYFRRCLPAKCNSIHDCVHHLPAICPLPWGSLSSPGEPITRRLALLGFKPLTVPINADDLGGNAIQPSRGAGLSAYVHGCLEIPRLVMTDQVPELGATLQMSDPLRRQPGPPLSVMWPCQPCSHGHQGRIRHTLRKTITKGNLELCVFRNKYRIP